jgi:hypothetical protein
MKSHSIAKELIRYAWLEAIVCAALSFLVLHISRSNRTQFVIYAIFVGVRIMIQALVNIAIIVYVYQHMPHASEARKRWTWYITGFLFAFVFFLCTDPVEMYLSDLNQGVWTLRGRLFSGLLQGAINNSLVLLVQTHVILRHEKMTIDLENSRLRAASLESANLLLKQQIHPHFLFNALSMLKSLYKTDVQAGEAYLSHLVNFLRASLSGQQSRLSRLSEELSLCEDYLEMQTIRFEKALDCKIDIPESIIAGGFVPAFSIQSLLENAIKHNVVTEAAPLAIRVYHDNGWIITENIKKPKIAGDLPSGKGLANLTERYKLLSGDEVIIRQDDHLFSVQIKVIYNENHHH